MNSENLAVQDLEIHGYVVKVTQVKADSSDGGTSVITAVKIFDANTDDELTLVLSDAERDELVASLTVL